MTTRPNRADPHCKASPHIRAGVARSISAQGTHGRQRASAERKKRKNPAPVDVKHGKRPLLKRGPEVPEILPRPLADRELDVANLEAVRVGDDGPAEGLGHRLRIQIRIYTRSVSSNATLSAIHRASLMLD